MSTLTPRDALEVDAETVEMAWRAGATRYEELTGNQIGEPDSDDLDAMRVALIAVLSNLVERTGEPVAYISQTALGALNKCRNDDHNGIVDVWMRPNDTLKATIPLYTAPGASHD